MTGTLVVTGLLLACVVLGTLSAVTDWPWRVIRAWRLGRAIVRHYRDFS